MANIKFSISAKTDVGCIRKNNEDNFQAASDLSQQQMSWVNNQSYDLGANGALLVVADGMGGMNAGEVASEIAIQTIKDFFTPDRITPEVTKTRFTIEKFMKEVVIEADNRIKAQSTAETHGMGTTIVIAWLYDGFCYVCWCGDSRAYIYNPTNGLFQISKDHSFVQTLVDAGKITEDEAFDYPDSNVITRCLCDAPQKAEPECMLTPQPLCNGDMIMLCSDGLCGMIRDRDIKEIMRANADNADVCVDQLIAAALRAGGKDNVTVAVARIESGGKAATADRVPSKTTPQVKVASTPAATPQKSVINTVKQSMPAWIWALIGFLAASALAACIFFFIFNKGESVTPVEPTDDAQTEAIPQVQDVQPAEKPAEKEQPSERTSSTNAPTRQNETSGENNLIEQVRPSSKTGDTGNTQNNNPDAGNREIPTTSKKPGGKPGLVEISTVGGSENSTATKDPQPSTSTSGQPDTEITAPSANNSNDLTDQIRQAQQNSQNNNPESPQGNSKQEEPKE